MKRSIKHVPFAMRTSVSSAKTQRRVEDVALGDTANQWSQIE